MLRTRLIALALAALAPVVSGCGGSSSSGQLTQAQLIAKADVICARLHKQYHTYGYTSIADAARLAPRVAAYEQVAQTELGKLTPPASMASYWRQFVAGTQTLASDTAKFARYAKEDNLKAALPVITSGQRTMQSMLATAKQDGFKECSQFPA